MCCLNEQQYNMYIVKMFEIVFTFNVKDINILDFPITFRNASVLCQSECICLHKTVNMAVFLVKSNENTYPKGWALMQMYRVVPITNRGNINIQLRHFPDIRWANRFWALDSKILECTHKNKPVTYLWKNMLTIITWKATTTEQSLQH